MRNRNQHYGLFHSVLPRDQWSENAADAKSGDSGNAAGGKRDKGYESKKGGSHEHNYCN